MTVDQRAKMVLWELGSDQSFNYGIDAYDGVSPIRRYLRTFVEADLEQPLRSPRISLEKLLGYDSLLQGFDSGPIDKIIPEGNGTYSLSINETGRSLTGAQCSELTERAQEDLKKPLTATSVWEAGLKKN